MLQTYMSAWHAYAYVFRYMKDYEHGTFALEQGPTGACLVSITTIYQNIIPGRSYNPMQYPLHPCDERHGKCLTERRSRLSEKHSEGLEKNVFQGIRDFLSTTLSVGVSLKDQHGYTKTSSVDKEFQKAHEILHF